MNIKHLESISAWRRAGAALVLAFALAGCGGGGGDAADEAPESAPPTGDPVFTVSVTVSGMQGRTGSVQLIRLDLITADEFAQVGDGVFTFTTLFPLHSKVAVIVPQMAEPWKCHAEPSPAGHLNVWQSNDVQGNINISIRCGAGHAVGGRIQGASAERPASLSLVSAGVNTGFGGVSQIRSGPFSFSGTLIEGMPYEVVSDNANCRVTNGTGIMPAHDVTDVLVECGEVQRLWRFDDETTQLLDAPLRGGEAGDGVVVYEEHTVLGGALTEAMGRLTGMEDRDIFVNLLDRPGANAAVYSNADGKTWWIASESIGFSTRSTTLETRWGVRRLGNEPAVFNLALTAIEFAASMDIFGSSDFYALNRIVRAQAEFEVRVHRLITLADGTDYIEPTPIHHSNDVALLEGKTPFAPDSIVWGWGPRVYAPARRPLLKTEMFNLVTRDNRKTGNAFLNQDVPIQLNLGALAPGERAVVVVRSRVLTQNRFNAESGAVAYLRDPATFDPGRQDQSAAVTEISGLALFAPPAFPADFAPQPDLTPAPACAAANLPRAVLQFELGSFSVNEDDPGGNVVSVTRSGSSVGEVSARLRMTAGTAQAGTDFVVREELIYFSDGDTTARSVRMGVIDDALTEANETLTLTLDQPSGCADIGANGATTVTILDDESLAPTQYTLGGTVTGLAGGSLVIDNAGTGPMTITANGAFQFPRTFLAGHVYLIQVSNQPQDPRQTCTVVNGAGTITNASIDNVQINCTTLADPGGLDSSFGTGGIAWTSTLWPHYSVTRLARQADGKLLVAGGKASLLRLLPDGTPDAGFGTAGNGLVTLTGARADSYAVNAVAVQPDGRIVVAGSATIGANGRSDMMVARWLPDGTLDPSFAGGTGVARVDHAQWNDGASQVLLQADGSILAIGGSQGSTGGGSDFTVLRLNSAGQVDTGYGANGWARIDVGGGFDAPRGAVLTPDGGVVLAGRVGPDGGSNGDIGLAKFTAGGVPDTGFGTRGDGTVRILTPEHDEASDIALLPDGRLLVVGERQLLGGPLGSAAYELWLARYQANGQLDTGFGNGGVATHPTQMRGRGLAVRADGAIWVASETPSTRIANSADFALARFTAGGQSDGSFGTAGVLPIDLFGGSDTPGALLLQPDGRLVLAGQAYNGANFGLGVVRVTP